MHSLPTYESLAIVLCRWKKDANLLPWQVCIHCGDKEQFSMRHVNHPKACSYVCSVWITHRFVFVGYQNHRLRYPSETFRNFLSKDLEISQNPFNEGTFVSFYYHRKGKKKSYTCNNRRGRNSLVQIACDNGVFSRELCSKQHVHGTIHIFDEVDYTYYIIKTNFCCPIFV